MSDTDQTLVEAIAKAQSEFPTIAKSHEAKVKMKAGGEYHYTYANLADTLAAVVPILSKNGIALLQPIITTDAGVEIQTVLLGHGDRMSSSMPLDIARLAPQEIGSLISYYRRYLLTSLLALAVDDDDGKSANDARRPKPKTSSKVRNESAPAPEGEPLSFDQLVTLNEYFDGLPDDVRKERKRAFAEQFGIPQEARRDRWPAIESWIAQ